MGHYRKIFYYKILNINDIFMKRTNISLKYYSFIKHKINLLNKLCSSGIDSLGLLGMNLILVNRKSEFI